MALRDLRTRWRSFALAALWAALATCLAVGTGSSAADLAASVRETYARLKFQDIVLYLRPSPASLVQEVAHLPGVAAVEGRATTRASLRAKGGAESFGSQIFGLPSRRRPEVNDLWIAEGSYLSAPREILMESRFAKSHGFRIGQEVILDDADRIIQCRLVGLVSSPEFIWVATDRYALLPTSDAVLYLSERDLSALVGDRQIDQILIRVESGTSVAEVIKALESKLQQSLKLPPMARELIPSHALLTRAQGVLALVSGGGCLAYLGLGCSTLGVVIWRLVRSQRGQIGALLCLGFSPRQLATYYMKLGMVVALIGAGLGVPLGVMMAWGLVRLYGGVLGLPFLNFTGHPLWTLGCLLVVSVATLLATALAVYPLFDLQPIEALRAEFGTATLSLWNPQIGPVWFRLAVRNLLRAPIRSLGSVLALSLCLGQMILVVALRSGEREALTFYFEKCVGYDFQADLKGNPSFASLPFIANWSGVERVEPVLRFYGWMAGSKGLVAESVWGIPSDCRLWGLFGEDGLPLPPPQGDTLLPGSVLATRLQAEPGSTLRMWRAWHGAGPRYQAPLDWVLGPKLREPVANPAKVSLRHLQLAMAAREDITFDAVSYLLIKVSPSQRAEVRRRLLLTPQILHVVDRQDIQKQVAEALKLLTALEWVLEVLAWLVTLIVIAAVAKLNIEEQHSEMNTLTLLGIDPRVLLRLRMVESALLWVAAVVPGLALGAVGGQWLLNRFQQDMLQMPLTLNLVGLVGSLLMGFFLSCVGTALSWRSMEGLPGSR